MSQDNSTLCSGAEDKGNLASTKYLALFQVQNSHAN